MGVAIIGLGSPMWQYGAVFKVVRVMVGGGVRVKVMVGVGVGVEVRALMCHELHICRHACTQYVLRSTNTIFYCYLLLLATIYIYLLLVYYYYYYYYYYYSY